MVSLPRMTPKTVVVVCSLIVLLYSFSMTFYAVWQKQSAMFRGHERMFEYCAMFSEDLDFYCVMARNARQLGFFYYVVRDSVQETPWCGGYKCSTLVPSFGWGGVAVGLGILYNLPILSRLWNWGYDHRPARLRAKHMAKQVQDARAW